MREIQPVHPAGHVLHIICEESAKLFEGQFEASTQAPFDK